MKQKKIAKAMAEVLEANDWIVRERVRCPSCARSPATHHSYCSNCGRKLTDGLEKIEPDIVDLLIEAYLAGKKADK